MHFRKFTSAVTSLVLAASAVCSGFGSAVTAGAAQANWKFDFGSGGVTSGFTGVSATDGYSASTGYGFAKTGSVSNVNAGGTGAGSDAVAFNDDEAGNTFLVDLPKGLYEVKVTVGNAPRCSIRLEGMLQMMNLTRLNATETVQIPVTDGQLSIQAVTGIAKGERSISAVEITQLNTSGEMKPTVWICGDSTVANYYNQADDAQHGWGQYLKQYINTNVFEVRNQATSGQYAKGFVQGGQFEAIEYYGKPGDYYIISIGINDQTYSNKEEYTEVVTDMVQRAKKKGMNVILVKQQGRHGDLSRNSLLGGRWFGGQMDAIGAAEQVTVIDDFTAWQNFGLEQGGYDAMTAYYAKDDDLHQSALGAQKNAELIAGMMKIGDTEMDTSGYYTFKNTNSGLVMDVEGGTMAEGTNLRQWDSNGQTAQIFQLTPFANGTTYYYMRSAADPNYCLKAMTGENGGNIELVPYNTKDSMMLFQFTKVGDGTYYISTRSSRDACFVEVDGASKSGGANVQQYSWTYNKCQNWQAVKVTLPEVQPTEQQPSEVRPPEPVVVPVDPASQNMAADLDGDGVVDVFDLALLKRAAAGNLSGNALKAADVNGDGAVDAKDVALLTDFIHGKKVEFAAPQTGDENYYAVDQTWEEGVIETTNAGFTRPEGYINLDNNDTSNITFTVNVPKDGNYMTHIRYANGSADDRQMKLFVNGDTANYWLQSFPGTGAWTDWTEIGIVLPLKAGVNTIKFLSALAGKGGPNLDYINLTFTDEPVAELYDPSTAVPEVPVGDKPTVYLASDSTCQYYGASKQAINGGPIQGWGYYLPNYFTEDVTVSNQAVAGRSSKKFYDEGRFANIVNTLKEGDYVMICFAINDAGKANADRYAPTCGNVNSPAEGSYEWYMTSFIQDTLAKGATPIIMSNTLNGSTSTGTYTATYTNYTDADKQLAAKYSVPFIDLNGIMVNYYNSIGVDAVYKLHMASVVEGGKDYTHFNEYGANIIAGIVANAVKEQKIEGLSSYVK